MAWIELHDTLPDHDKVLQVAEALKMDKDMVVGKLIRLWTWAVNNRESGVFRARDINTIAEVMRYKGKASRLVCALTEARLLDCDEDTYTIHDWDERVGMLMEKRETRRAQTRARVQKHRAKNSNAKSSDCETPCNALQECYTTPDVTQCNAATVPKPYLDDEDDVEDAYRAREGELDTWKAAYTEADRIVAAAYKASFGREATTAEIEHLSRIAVLSGKTALIGEAIHRAAAHGAKAVGAYVAEIIKDWRYQEVDTAEELARYDYLQDCINGKAAVGMEQAQAFDELRKHREDKQRQRKGGGSYG